MTDMELLRSYAIKFVGVPYRFGGSHPSQGLDCSGLCIELLVAFGLLPHGFDTTAQGLAGKFPNKTDSPDLGDLVFFGPSESKITHVGFCLNESLMLEAGGGNSTTVTMQEAVRHNAFVRIRPIKYRKDFRFVTRPDWGA